MPKLWSATIDAHRREVREAILDTTWTLATEHGPAAVTMSEVAEKAGIGRATLYKYFPDVEAILAAWHHRQIGRHLDQLAEVRDAATDPESGLPAVLTEYAHIHQRRVQRSQRPHGAELSILLHRDDHVADARRRLHAFMRDLLAEAARVGNVRSDITPDELAGYCLHALTAASALPPGDGLARLVTLVLDGLRTHAGDPAGRQEDPQSGGRDRR